MIVEDVGNGWEQIDKPPSCAPFTGRPGLNVELGNDPQPIDFFNVLFKSSMWDLLVEQTNIYADNCIQDEELKSKSRLANRKFQKFAYL